MVAKIYIGKGRKVYEMNRYINIYILTNIIYIYRVYPTYKIIIEIIYNAFTNDELHFYECAFLHPSTLVNILHYIT